MTALVSLPRVLLVAWWWFCGCANRARLEADRRHGPSIASRSSSSSTPTGSSTLPGLQHCGLSVSPSVPSLDNQSAEASSRIGRCARMAPIAESKLILTAAAAAGLMQASLTGQDKTRRDASAMLDAYRQGRVGRD